MEGLGISLTHEQDMEKSRKSHWRLNYMTDLLKYDALGDNSKGQHTCC